MILRKISCAFFSPNLSISDNLKNIVSSRVFTFLRKNWYSFFKFFESKSFPSEKDPKLFLIKKECGKKRGRHRLRKENLVVMKLHFFLWFFRGYLLWSWKSHTHWDGLKITPWLSESLTSSEFKSRSSWGFSSLLHNPVHLYRVHELEKFVEVLVYF